MSIAHLKEISESLVALLRQRHTVVLPDFGGFTGIYESAQVDHLEGVSRPPSLRISFNRDLRANDGLLIGYLVDHYGWSVEEAEQRLAAFVEDLTAALQARKIVEFSGLGKLYMDFDKRYSFIQESENLNRDAFGLPEVQTPIVQSEVKQEVPARSLEKEKKQAQPLEDLPQKSKPAVALATAWWQTSLPWVILMSLVVLLVSGYFLRKQHRLRKPVSLLEDTLATDRLNVPPSSGIASDETDEMLFEDEMEDATDMNGGEGQEEQLFEEESEAPTLPPDTKEAVIIVGSFSHVKNAERLIQRLYEDGYDAYSDRRSGRTRVGIRFAYASEAELYDYLEQMKNKYNVDAWILGQ